MDIEKAHYTFPERLMELLERERVKEAMWWLPGGSAFAIKPAIFYDVVLAKYFQGTKFESFTRKLNRWGFRRLASQGIPQSTVAYYNKSFKQGQPQLVKNMRSGNKGSKFQEAEKPPCITPKAPPATEGEHAQVTSLRGYLKNQSMSNAVQYQEAGVNWQQPADPQLLASLHQQQSFPSAALLGHPENLVTMQRRARMQAAHQFVTNGGIAAGTLDDIRGALFARLGRGLVDNVPVPPMVQPVDALNPQVIQLLLLQERLGQSGIL